MVFMTAASSDASSSGEAAARPPGGPDLAELLRRSAQSDESAFAELYDATSRRIFGLVLRIVRDHAMSEEVTQEVYFDTTAESAHASLEAQRVRRALSTLTDAQRSAVELAYLGGYTHTEVARLLDLPLGTAKTRIRDGLIRLRDTLGVPA